MDDRTTTNYQAQHLGYFHGRKDATAQWNPALQFESLSAPEELSFSSWEPAAASGAAPAARTGVQPAIKTLHGVPGPIEPARPARNPRNPRASTERTLSHGWQAAPAPQMVTAGFTLASPLELPKLQPAPANEENPFAQRSAFTYWLMSTAAGLGLFGAVLLGRVVLVAGGQGAAKLPAAEVSASTPPPTAATPSDAPAPAQPSADVRSPEPVQVAPPRAQPASTAAAPRRASESAPEGTTRSRAAVDGSASAIGHAARTSSTDSSSARGPRSSGAAADADAPARTRKASRDAADAVTAAPSGAPGLLRVNSRPWSQVTLDGNAVGHTPLMDLRVAPGSHSLRLVNPEFGLSKTIQVKVAAGETVTRVELLEPQ